MNWFAKFEKKFSKYAIKNLMFYIIVLYAIGFVMNTFFNGCLLYTSDAADE